MDDKVSDYIVAMKGSAYDDVSIRQLLTMTSGVQWNEDYADPNSDVARFNNHQPEEGVDALVSYLRRLPACSARRDALELQHRRDQPRRHPSSAGGEKAAGAIPVGEDQARRHGAAGHVDPLQDRARDQRLLHPGRIARLRALRRLRAQRRACRRAGHLRPTAGSRRRASAPTSAARRGYGYQWWTYDDGSFAARGIFGQGIFIDPKRKLVIASNADWGGGARPRRERGTRGVLPGGAQGRSTTGVRTRTRAGRVALTTGGGTPPASALPLDVLLIGQDHGPTASPPTCGRRT